METDVCHYDRANAGSLRGGKSPSAGAFPAICVVNPGSWRFGSLAMSFKLKKTIKISLLGSSVVYGNALERRSNLNV